MIVGGEGGGRVTGGFGRQLRAALLSTFVLQPLTFFMNSEALEHIEGLAEHLASGAVTAAVGQQFTLQEVPSAIQAMQDGRLTGKAVITLRS